MKRIKADIIIFVFLCLVSVFLYIETLDFPAGAETFPKVMLVIIFGLSAYQIIASALRKQLLKTNEQVGKEKQVDKKEIYNPYLIFVFSVIYALLITRLGFFTSTVVFIIGSTWYLGTRNLKTFVISTLGITVFIYFLFIMQLHVPLPKGILF
jgi:putative tricarboxylic transport membrane protein